ncbi:MAG: hypothetical protein KGH53_00445 [Candidatus Micrarchaeota archaeon]|nr:hypothetical protein [Candidatus Micrarchaeota archaeon]
MAEDTGISSETSSFIKTIDKQLGDKYVVSLQEIVADQNALARKQNAKEIVSNMKGDVNSYFDSLLKNLEDEERRFTAELQSASTLYAQINDHIKAKAQSMNVPMIKPVSVERNEEGEETIIISAEDTAVELLVGRLIGSCTYVADLSTTYKTYTIGSWLFSGEKNYNLSINPPSSVILNIEESRDEINFRLDSIQGRL